MADQRILERRAACPIHVQARVVDVTPPASWPGKATLRARVVHVFRGEFVLGQAIEIWMATFREGSAAPPPGQAHYEWTRLQGARYVEVCLERAAHGIALPFNECSKLLEAPTEAPVLALADRVSRRRRRSLRQRLLSLLRTFRSPM